MNAPRLVRYADTPEIAWKNGGGVTRQLAIHPPQATAAEFEWRVSIARLDESAPFSEFAGIERCLAVLQGELRLSRAGTEPQTLHERSAPITFAGDTPSHGEVLRGPVLDLNLMYQATRWRASMSRLDLAGGSVRVLPSCILCSLARQDVQLAGRHIELELYDLLMPAGADLLALNAAFSAYRLQLEPR